MTEDELKKEFLTFGEVESVSIIKDKYSGLSRGYAFIEMPLRTNGEAAINNLKGKMLKNRMIEVNEARPRSGLRSDRNQIGGSNISSIVQLTSEKGLVRKARR